MVALTMPLSRSRTAFNRVHQRGSTVVGLGDRMVEHRHRNPAIVAGSLLSPFAGAKPLLVVTGLLVLVFGVSFLVLPQGPVTHQGGWDNPEGLRPAYCRARLVAVAIGVGLISGLLANAGGFLLVPCNHALSRFRASRPPVGYQSRPLRNNDYELCIGRLLVYALCVCWYMFSVRIQC